MGKAVKAKAAAKTPAAKTPTAKAPAAKASAASAPAAKAPAASAPAVKRKVVKPIPEGQHSVTPYLVVRGATDAIDPVPPPWRAIRTGGCPAPTTVARPVTGLTATHIAVIKERAPKMLRKSLFTASITLAGSSCSTLP